eukprot:8721563-Pyramimonas_sp.AAC.1
MPRRLPTDSHHHWRPPLPSQHRCGLWCPLPGPPFLPTAPLSPRHWLPPEASRPRRRPIGPR